MTMTKMNIITSSQVSDDNLQQPENNGSLQEQKPDASITASAAGNTGDGAAAQAAEDTHQADPRDEIINQQNATIDTLLKRTEELTGQINKLISMGVQITDGTPGESQSIDNNIPEDYVSLSDLGADIGKRDK